MGGLLIDTLGRAPKKAVRMISLSLPPMPPTRPKLRETLFFVWATLSEHKWVTFGERRGVGSPDVFAMRKGVCYGIECKGDKGRQSDAQKEFQVRFEAAGGVYVLAKGIDEVENTIT
jgi:hypothetical protein